MPNSKDFTQIDFKTFVLKSKQYRWYLWVSLSAIILQFCIFKYLYPFPSFIHGDSFSYLRSAANNMKINTYMIGYSKFMRLFSVFTSSSLALTAFQYIFIQVSCLLLLFSIFYFYRLGKAVELILIVFAVLNPLFLHLANMVSSDGYFFALSTLWFTSMLWLIHKPFKGLILLHAAVLYLAFITRYNGLIYPFISIAAFAFSKIPLRLKLAGIGASAILCLSFVIYTSYEYKKLTGYWQYSPFSGWQWANNAMYAYRYVDSADRKPVKKEFAVLDKMIREYFDSTRNTARFPYEKIQASTFYMWSAGMPLMAYREKVRFKKDSITKEFKRWATMGPYYSRFGKYMIKKYPWEYFENFILPNALKYYAPPVEFLGAYNSGQDTVQTVAQNWFNFKTNKVYTRMKLKEVWILDYYPILTGLINVVVVFMLVCFFSLNGWKNNKTFNKIVFLGGLIWLLNAVFTIIASSVALRFQAFPIILTTILAVLLINWMVQLMHATKEAEEFARNQVETKKHVNIAL